MGRNPIVLDITHFSKGTDLSERNQIKSTDNCIYSVRGWIPFLSGSVWLLRRAEMEKNNKPKLDEKGKILVPWRRDLKGSQMS